RSFDGTTTILQPMIEHLYDSHSFISVLDAIVQYPGRSSYEILRAYWNGQHTGADFEDWWRRSVCDGLIRGSALPAITPALKPNWSASLSALPTAPSGLDLVFRTDPYIFDGRYANNTWLQELPRPMTKLTWDNAVHLSPSTAKRLKLDS